MARRPSKKRRPAPPSAAREPLQLTLFPDLGSAPAAAGAPAPREASGVPAATLAPPASLERRLGHLLEGRLESLVLTRNRSRIFSARTTAAGGLAVRIHRGFADASDELLGEVAGYLLGRFRGARRRRALAAVREHFERCCKPAEPRASRRRRIRPVGRRWDLREIRDEVNRRYFGGELEVEITWSTAPSRRRKRWGRRTIQLGSYVAEDRLVRIHPALDRPGVPRYVVAAVIYHEMLHAAMPPETRGGRRVLHPPELRRRERLFEQHEAAERWLARHLTRLIDGGVVTCR